MSTVPSGVLPFTASGPSAMLPAHPARWTMHAITIATRATIDFFASEIIECLLCAGRLPLGTCHIHSTRVEVLQVGTAMGIAHLLGRARGCACRVACRARVRSSRGLAHSLRA